MNPRWAKVGGGRRATTPSEHDLHGFLREGHPRVAVPVCTAVRSRPEGAAEVQEQEGGRDGQETRRPDDVPRVAGVHRHDQGQARGRRARRAAGLSPAVPEAEVRRLTNRIEEGTLAPKLKMSFDKGESVRVIEGPFQNFNGLVDDVNPDKGKLRVLVSIFGRSTPVELDFSQVEKN